MAIDSNIGGSSTDNRTITARLTQGRYLDIDRINIEYEDTSYNFAYMNGYKTTNNGSSDIAWMWKRAPSFLDVVCYTGTGSARTIAHNLTVAPEMMWVKRRDGQGQWAVYHSGTDSSPATKRLYFNLNNAVADEAAPWNDTAPTASVFTVGTAGGGTNDNNETFIAYLFATLAGISKVGIYTGNGSNQTINCGFSAGAKFILIKRINATGNWYVWDTVRGINAGNEIGLIFNSTTAITNDSIDSENSGFIVNQVSNTDVNVSSATYIFYAIA